MIKNNTEIRRHHIFDAAVTGACNPAALNHIPDRETVAEDQFLLLLDGLERGDRSMRITFGSDFADGGKRFSSRFYGRSLQKLAVFIKVVPPDNEPPGTLTFNCRLILLYSF